MFSCAHHIHLLSVSFSLQWLAALVLPTAPPRDEIVVEDAPPLTVIQAARAERNKVIDSLGASEPPPRSFWSRRRLRAGDQWYVEVSQAKPQEGKSRFFTSLVVSLGNCRRDVYAVSKVGASSQLLPHHCCYYSF